MMNIEELGVRETFLGGEMFEASVRDLPVV